MLHRCRRWHQCCRQQRHCRLGTESRPRISAVCVPAAAAPAGGRRHGGGSSNSSGKLAPGAAACRNIRCDTGYPVVGIQRRGNCAVKTGLLRGGGDQSPSHPAQRTPFSTHLIMREELQRLLREALRLGKVAGLQCALGYAHAPRGLLLVGYTHLAAVPAPLARNCAPRRAALMTLSTVDCPAQPNSQSFSTRCC